MRKLGSALSSLVMVGSLGAILTGCPVWGDGGTGGGGPGPSPDGGTVLPDAPPANACTTSASCPAGQYCAPRGACEPGCSVSSDCARLGAGLVCNTATRACVPSGGCATDAECASTPSTPVCLGGSCQARASQCQFDYQCTGSGQACVDGRCVVGCTAATASMVCAPGQTCTSGRCIYPTAGSCSAACPTGQLCVSGACLRPCADDAACGAGFMCDHGVCRVDTRPRPFCTMDSDCNRDSICYNGACRRLCPMPGTGADGACLRVDVQFDLCRQDMMGRSLCTSSNEQMPQCARTANCPAGRECVNARCQ